VPTERTLRLATGLILFAFATCHFLSHATGLFGMDAIEGIGRRIFLAPWRTIAGQCILFAALFIHGGLGLRALIRRRSLRMPPLEAVQLGLGLLIPLLMIPHAANVRLGSILYGLDDSYFRIVYQYFLTTPFTGLPRQFCLMLAVWIHGCIGLHMYLRISAWYRGAVAWLLALAIAIPALAVLGLNGAGWDSRLRATVSTEFSQQNGPPPAGTADAARREALETLWDRLCVAYVLLVIGAFAYRALRGARASERVRIQYPERPVLVPKGFSVLEASRWVGIPHMSVCGGRARCSTCRIRVTSGFDQLPKPSAEEQATLERIGAPAHVRLACQLRPQHDLGIRLLIPTPAMAGGMRVAADDGVELVATVLAVDLRDSTRLAVEKLPFDALFIVDRYIQRVSAEIVSRGGYVTSIAGDGVMSVFGTDGDARQGARNALAAAAAIWHSLDRLNVDLATDLTEPLRFGMGIHSGSTVIGSVVLLGRQSVQFLGDTGNVAARLETLSKDLAAALVISDIVFRTAETPVPDTLPHDDVVVRGREAAPLRVLLARDAGDLAALRAEALSI